MSKLEFVAIQFGVKFVIICQFTVLCGWSLPAISTLIQLFRNFTIFTNYFMILSEVYLFSRSFCFIPYMDLRP